MNDRLKNKAVIVIGAGTGIGAATARRLAAEGARVAVADINLPAAEAVAADLVRSGGQAFAVPIDIADVSKVEAAVGTTLERFGRLDGVHVNAADMRVIFEDSDAMAEDLAVFDRTLSVNLRGHLLCTRAVLPHLLHGGGGAIVYTSSGASVAGEPTRPAYAVAKGGLEALMRHVASKWGRQGITANCVAPGLTITPEIEASGGFPMELVEQMLRGTPHRRLGRAEDTAGVVAMLLSEDGRWVNGQVWHVNGGQLMR